MFFIYVLKSVQKNYKYIGNTNNIDRRLVQHNTGKVRSTKPYRPLELIHTEKYSTRTDARNREKFLKSGSGREWIRVNLI